MELEGISTKDLHKKSLFYGVKAWIKKIKNDMNSFYGEKKGRG